MPLNYLLIGLSLGITAGLSPGPLMALMISETVKGGKKAGIKVSLAPLFTDIPLILAIMLILNQIQNMDLLLGIISLTGAFVLFYFGYTDLRTKNIGLHTGNLKSNSFKKGLLTNLFNPHPYLFWLFIGVPFMVKGNLLERAGFVLSFFSGIVGSKICLALIVEKGKKFIESKHYLRIIKFLGLILVFFGLILLRDGIGYLVR